MIFKTSTSSNHEFARLDNTKIDEIRFRVPRWMKEDVSRYCDGIDVSVAHILRQSIREILRKSQEVTK